GRRTRLKNGRPARGVRVQVAPAAPPQNQGRAAPGGATRLEHATALRRLTVQSRARPPPQRARRRGCGDRPGRPGPRATVDGSTPSCSATKESAMQVLVLNTTYEPLAIVTLKRAMRLLTTRKAEVIEA